MKHENYYVRFGKIPENGKSGIYRGDAGKIGEEQGISCYRAYIYDDKILCVLSLKEMHDSCIYDFAEDAISGYKYVKDNIESNIQSDEISIHKEYFPIYLVTGNEIGTGSSGEPLLSDVKIVNELFYDNGYLRCFNREEENE